MTACGCRTVMSNPLIDKLDRIAALSDAEKQVLTQAASRTRAVRAHVDIVQEGEEPTGCRLLLDGFACRYKLLPAGKRQIIGLQIAGDLCDLSGLILGRMDHSVGTLTAAIVALIPRTMMLEIMERHPRIARALWQETLADAAISREWVANIGRRSAEQRIAHLLCEMALRLNAVGRARNGSFAWPVTQAEIGDATGLSTVHVNRVLQGLRGDGLIAFVGGKVVILDWERLQQTGEFRPDYLYANLRSDGDGQVHQQIA